MLNETVFWIEKVANLSHSHVKHLRRHCTACNDRIVLQIEREQLPTMQDPNADAETRAASCHCLSRVLVDVKTLCSRGSRRCKGVLMRKAIADGSYRMHSTPQSMADFLSAYADELCTIEIDQTIPQWVSFDEALLDIALDNSVSNAKLHGKKSGHVVIRAAAKNGSISVIVMNKPGPFHEQCRTLQSKQKDPLRGITKMAQQHSLGTKGSTFLGMEEIYDAIQMLDGATADLDFWDSCVMFTVQFPLVVVPALGSSPDTAPLRENTILFGKPLPQPVSQGLLAA